MSEGLVFKDPHFLFTKGAILGGLSLPQYNPKMNETLSDLDGSWNG